MASLIQVILLIAMTAIATSFALILTGNWYFHNRIPKPQKPLSTLTPDVVPGTVCVFTVNDPNDPHLYVVCKIPKVTHNTILVQKPNNGSIN